MSAAAPMSQNAMSQRYLYYIEIVGEKIMPNWIEWRLDDRCSRVVYYDIAMALLICCLLDGLPLSRIVQCVSHCKRFGYKIEIVGLHLNPNWWFFHVMEVPGRWFKKVLFIDIPSKHVQTNPWAKGQCNLLKSRSIFSSVYFIGFIYYWCNAITIGAAG